MIPFEFKTSLEITKAYEENGKVILIGEASGPELDLDEERMSKKAISNMAKQIKEAYKSGTPIPLRDAHVKDGVLMDLGALVDASVSDQSHLVTKSELDLDNPAAVKLHKDLLKGKKYGLSVRGDAVAEQRFDEEIQKRITVYDDVNLKEVSVTVKPAWSHSFLVSLSKSYKKAMSNIEKAEFTEEERKKLAESGEAMSDGSYPIRNKEDLKNAVEAFGRSKDPEATKKHIISRARALGAVSELPEKWGVKKSVEEEDETTDVDPEKKLEVTEPDNSTEEVVDSKSSEESVAVEQTQSTEVAVDESNATQDEVGKEVVKKSVEKSAIDIAIYDEIQKCIVCLQNILNMQSADIQIDADEEMEEVESYAEEGKSSKEKDLPELEVVKSENSELKKSISELTAKVEFLMKQPLGRKGVALVTEVTKARDADNPAKAEITRLLDENAGFQELYKAADGDMGLINEVMKEKQNK